MEVENEDKKRRRGATSAISITSIPCDVKRSCAASANKLRWIWGVRRLHNRAKRFIFFFQQTNRSACKSLNSYGSIWKILSKSPVAYSSSFSVSCVCQTQKFSRFRFNSVSIWAKLVWSGRRLQTQWKKKKKERRVIDGEIGALIRSCLCWRRRQTRATTKDCRENRSHDTCSSTIVTFLFGLRSAHLTAVFFQKTIDRRERLAVLLLAVRTRETGGYVGRRRLAADKYPEMEEELKKQKDTLGSRALVFIYKHRHPRILFPFIKVFPSLLLLSVVVVVFFYRWTQTRERGDRRRCAIDPEYLCIIHRTTRKKEMRTFFLLAPLQGVDIAWCISPLLNKWQENLALTDSDVGMRWTAVAARD